MSSIGRLYNAFMHPADAVLNSVDAFVGRGTPDQQLLELCNFNPEGETKEEIEDFFLSCSEKAEELLRRGANPNFMDSSGSTPLFNAANKGNIMLLSLLMKYGADPFLSPRRETCGNSFGSCLEQALHTVSSYFRTERSDLLLR